MYFTQDPNGLYVGYHFEDGENFDEAGGVRLSMDTLVNDRPLYMGNEPNTEWSSSVYNTMHGRLLAIHFQPVKFFQFTSHVEYMELTHVKRTPKKAHHYVPKGGRLEKLLAEGYRGFVIIENDLDELQEGFLMCPKDHVVSIQDITSAFKVSSLYHAINT